MIRFLQRLGGALAVLPHTYEDIERDETALPQAVTVVVLSSLATGVAFLPEFGLRGLFASLLGTMLAWLCWSWLTYHIGVRWLPERATEANWGQLLRTTGFAAAPGTLRVVAIIPEAMWPVFLLTWGWMLAGFVMAVRQALDYESTWRAILASLTGAVVYLGVLFLLPSACRLQG